MMAHAGVAVSITNITDILSFAIGCITELPGIEFFCSYACVTITFCYIYQVLSKFCLPYIVNAVADNCLALAK